MSASLTLDIVEGTEIVLDNNLRRRVRVGQANNLDIEAGNEYFVLDAVVSLLAANNIGRGIFHPSLDGTRLTKIRVAPLSPSGNCCRIYLYYDAFLEGSLATGFMAFILNDHSYLSSIQTNILRMDLSGSTQMIKTSWKDPNSSANVPEDYVTMSFLSPLRCISITAINQNNTAPKVSDLVGYVNSDTWCGYKPGWWILNEYESNVQTIEGFYSYRASALKRNYGDWGEMGTLISPLTKKAVAVTDADMDSLATSPYTRGLQTKNGAVKVGYYPMTSFGDIFGFNNRNQF